MKKEEIFFEDTRIIGFENGDTDPESEDVKATLRMIRERVEAYTPEQKLHNKLYALRIQMYSFAKLEYTKTAKTAPEFLREFINAINVKNKDFAKYLNLKESNLSAILNGNRRINIELAFKLGQLFEMSPELWLQVQTKHEMMEMEKTKKLEGKKYKLEDLMKRA